MVKIISIWVLLSGMHSFALSRDEKVFKKYLYTYEQSLFASFSYLIYMYIKVCIRGILTFAEIISMV